MEFIIRLNFRAKPDDGFPGWIFEIIDGVKTPENPSISFSWDSHQENVFKPNLIYKMSIRYD